MADLSHGWRSARRLLSKRKSVFVLVGTLGVATAIGYVIRRRMAKAIAAAIPQEQWTYWAEPLPSEQGKWEGWIERGDVQYHVPMNFDSAQDAENAAREEIVDQGAIPLLSIGSPAGPRPGLEGIVANYVGSGWSWPRRDVFPTELDIIRELYLLGYDVSGNEVLSPQNMQAAKWFQSDYNSARKLGLSSMVNMPPGLIADGLLGVSSLDAMAEVLRRFPHGSAETWQSVVTRARNAEALPSWAKKLIAFGGRYGSAAAWSKNGVGTSNAKTRIRKFQRDYNCITASTDLPPLVVDGKLGAKTMDAINYAAAFATIGVDWVQEASSC